jgi:uncharacterized protein YjbI with pentapeptide repeats/GTPase SAR1 family protein
VLTSPNDYFQKGLIITDNPSNSPILDFNSYTGAIVKIVKQSYPHFVIGIIGDWGTGKTTLMNSIKKELETEKESVTTAWFDAWKYESEKQFALIPLLKTISYSIKDDNDQKKKNLKEVLKEVAFFSLGISNDVLSSIIANYAGKELGGIFKKSLEDVTTKLIPQLKDLKKLSEADKDSIFYSGISNIQEAINAIRYENPEFKIVIFIDDLDRCSEGKVLEILESMKIFLSLDGIVYILGMNYDRVIDLINKRYEIKVGEQYLKKFIQIPIFLTEWNQDEIINLIDDFIDNGIIGQDYKTIIGGNKAIIAAAIEENPREIKRFLNNLIISYEAFVNIQGIREENSKSIFLKQLLLVQILKSNWRDVYTYLITYEGKFLEDLRDSIPVTKEKIDDILASKSELDATIRGLFEKHKSDMKLWKFLNRENFDFLRSINNWNIFRRASKFTDRSYWNNTINRASQTLDNLSLVSSVFEFADFRNSVINTARLSDVKIENADFREALIKSANFADVNIENADFGRASVTSVHLADVKIENANFREALIVSTDFIDVKIENADFKAAAIKGSRFISLKIENADFTKASIESVNLADVKIENADFTKASVQSVNFADVIFNISKITNTLFSKVKFENVDLSGANLTNSDFLEVSFEYVDLSGANLTNTVFIGTLSYNHLTIDSKTNFLNAVIDDPILVEYLRQNNCLNVPKTISTKSELSKILDERRSGSYQINEMLRRLSKLPS